MLHFDFIVVFSFMLNILVLISIELPNLIVLLIQRIMKHHVHSIYTRSTELHRLALINIPYLHCTALRKRTNQTLTHHH